MRAANRIMTNVNSIVHKISRAALACVGAALLASPLVSTSASAQIAGADAFNLPEDISFILTPGDPMDRRAVARVNGIVITATDIDHRLALIAAAQRVTIAPEEMARLRLQVFFNLVDETIQVQEADALDMTVTTEEVNQTYAEYAARQGRGISEMDEYLASLGSSSRSVKRQIQGELAWERLLLRNVRPFVNVSEAEVTELWERLQENRGETEYRIGEIFLSANINNREQVLANASQIVDQLQQGGSFAAYARQFSEASSAINGGDLGWLFLPQLQQPQLEATAAQMQPGQLVGPLEIPGGFSILLMIDQRQIGMPDPRDAVLNLKEVSFAIPAGASEAEIESLAGNFIEQMQTATTCEQADALALSLGATTVDNPQIAARQLPPAFQQILLGLEVGQLTPPFGDLTESVRMIMLCDREMPTDTSGPSVEDLMAQLEDERINRRAQRYLRDLRRDAVIEYN